MTLGKRVAVVAGIAAVLAAAGGLGVLVGANLDHEEDEPEHGITEAEHNRLIEACGAETEAPAECLPWVADLVADAEAEGCSYEEVASAMVLLLRNEPGVEAARARVELREVGNC